METVLSVAGWTSQVAKIMQRKRQASEFITPASWSRKTWFTRGRVRQLKNAHNSVTVQNRTHVYMNFFDHKDLGNHLMQYCPQVVKHPVYIYIFIHCPLLCIGRNLYRCCSTVL